MAEGDRADEDDISFRELLEAALDRPRDEPFIRFNDVWYDHGWLTDAALRIDQLLREAGIRKDDPIGFIPRNRPEFAAALVGLLMSGQHVVMIYAYQSPDALALKVRNLKVPFVVAGEEDWSEQLRAATAEVGAAGFALPSAPGLAEPIADLPLRRNDDMYKAPERPGIELLTSGTTGPPKQFAIPSSTIVRAARSEAEVAVRNGKPTLHYMPFGNIAGVYSFLPLLITSQPIIMLEKFVLDEWINYVREMRPVAYGAPVAAFRMLLEAKVDPEALSSLKFIVTGAATLEPSVRREFEQKYNVPILQSYGATEFCGVVAMVLPEDREKYGDAKADSVGKAWAGAAFEIRDPETGAPLPPNTQGQLMVKTPRVGSDWIATTDLAMLDEDGFLYHCGRMDGAIMRGGFKIVPETVATAISEHPSVAAASVVGMPDARLGHVPVAAIELRQGADRPTSADMEAFLRKSLPATYLPVAYRFEETLPRTPSLKIDQAGVKMLFEKDFPVVS